MTLLSNGRPIAGCAVRIGFNSGVLGEREIGEILVQSPFMFSRYYRNPAATECAWQDGWFRTGDLGFIDGGEIFVVGRLKGVIIVNGKNVFAQDIEGAVSMVDGVKPGRCVAFGVYAERVGSEQLIVIAECASPADLAAANDIAMRINQAVLEECSVPCVDIRVVEQGWLVKTTSGKMSRSENAKKYASLLAANG